MLLNRSTVILGRNSTWAYTSNTNLNSIGDENIPPSGIVRSWISTPPANLIDTGNQDNWPLEGRVTNQLASGTQNQIIRD